MLISARAPWAHVLIEELASAAYSSPDVQVYLSYGGEASWYHLPEVTGPSEYSRARKHLLPAEVAPNAGEDAAPKIKKTTRKIPQPVAATSLTG
jgi:hypothetical protein